MDHAVQEDEEKSTLELPELVRETSDLEREALVAPNEQARTSFQHHHPIDNILLARRLLYTSHAFAQFSEIAWQFGLAIFLAAHFYESSLVVVSTYGFTVSLAVCGGVGKLGKWVDDDACPRLRLVRWLIVLENVSVVLATLFCYMMLLTSQSSSMGEEEPNSNSIPTTDVRSIIALVMIHLLGATAQVLDQVFTVAMERDWVVVLCEAAAAAAEAADNSFSEWLSQTNIAMKQIDLSCKMMAPAVIGVLLPTRVEDLKYAALAIGALNVLSLIVEYACTAKVYRLVPLLGHKQRGVAIDNEKEECQPVSCEDDLQRPFCHELVLYFTQPIAWGGVALALLYVNAVTFGNGIMTAYLLFRGLDLQVIGALRGLASVIGLLGTCMFRFLSKRFSLETTGMMAISYQCTCLGMSSAALFLSNTNMSLLLLIMGVCLSRIGLWVFDISVTQMQQQEIPDGIRGRVGGVQQSLNSFFNLLSFVAGFVFRDPRDFYVFVWVGFWGVSIALILFFVGVFGPRKLLGHSSIPTVATSATTTL